MSTEIRLGSYLYRDPRDFEHVRADSATLLRTAGENGARRSARRAGSGAWPRGCSPTS